MGHCDVRNACVYGRRTQVRGELQRAIRQLRCGSELLCEQL